MSQSRDWWTAVFVLITVSVHIILKTIDTLFGRVNIFFQEKKIIMFEGIFNLLVLDFQVSLQLRPRLPYVRFVKRTCFWVPFFFSLQLFWIIIKRPTTLFQHKTQWPVVQTTNSQANPLWDEILDSHFHLICDWGWGCSVPHHHSPTNTRLPSKQLLPSHVKQRGCCATLLVIENMKMRRMEESMIWFLLVRDRHIENNAFSTPRAWRSGGKNTHQPIKPSPLWTMSIKAK